METGLKLVIPYLSEALRFVFAIVLLLSLSNSVAPTVIFDSQSPADITSLNAIASYANFTFNISGADLNESTIRLYYSVNDTSSSCVYFANGSCSIEFASDAYGSKIGGTYKWRLDDNEIYPATYTFTELAFSNILHTTYSLVDVSAVISTELFNVSNNTQYGWFEVMANGTGGQAFGVYYCNSSYLFNVKITSSPNCYQFGSQASNAPWNHVHGANSAHKLFPFPVNTTTGKIGTVFITSQSYFMVVGAPSGTTNVFKISNTTRASTTKTNLNKGDPPWTNQTYSVDAHLHQFRNSTSFWYYACANDTSNIQSCSTPIKQEPLDLGGVPPSSPLISVTGAQPALNITWQAASSPNGYAISYYNVSLLNSDDSFNQTINANTSNLWANWTAPSLAGGNYVIRVQAVDNISQSSYGYMDISLCGAISAANTSISLLSSVSINGSTCFNVTAANVTLDCAGYSVTGNNSTTTYGLYSNQNFTSVKNCNMSNFGAGIYFNNANNGTIENNNISITNNNFTIPTYSSAIILYTGANYNMLRNNNATSASGYGIYLSTTNNNQISGSFGGSNNQSGIYMLSSSNNSISNSAGTSNSGYGIYFNGASNNLISNSTGTSGNQSGISLYSSSSNTISRSTGTSGNQSGIYVGTTSNYNTISDSNGSSTSKYGISIEGSLNNNITSSTGASNSSYGVQILNSNNTVVTSSTSTSNASRGLFLSGSVNNTVSNSTISGNGGTFGALAISSSSIGNTIANSTINGNNASYAVTFKTGSNTGNFLINNTIFNATTSLLYVEAGNDNTFYWNNFTNTSGKQISDLGHDNVYLQNIWSQTVGTAISITGANNSIDCNGSSITGNNSSSAYGVYSTGFNTTVKNCIISNFQHGIFFDGADNGTIQSNTATTTFSSGYGIYLKDIANYNNLTNNFASSASTHGIYVFCSGGINNTLTNNTGISLGTSTGAHGIYLNKAANSTLIGNNGTSSGGDGIQLFSNSNFATLINNTGTGGVNGIKLDGVTDSLLTGNNGTAGTGNGIFLTSSNNNSLSNNIGRNNVVAGSNYYSGIRILNSNYTTITGGTGNCTSSSNGITISGSINSVLNNVASVSNSGYGLQILASSNNTIANSTIRSNSSIPIGVLGNSTVASSGNVIYNNTFISSLASKTLLYLNATAGGNTFYWNNFTETSGFYVNDTNGSNFYNSTLPGQNEGNFWPEVMNGSVTLRGANNSIGFPALYVSSTGGFNNSSSAKLLGVVFDYVPLTPLNQGNLPPVMSQSAINATQSPIYPNSTLLGWCNATDPDGDAVSYNYSWFVNGTLFLSNSTASNFTQGTLVNVANISSANLLVGQSWVLECLAFDGLANSSHLNSSSVNTSGYPFDGILTINITFASPPSSFNITKAPLKYNKDFAFSYSFDDGYFQGYSNAYHYMTGGIVNTTAVYSHGFYTGDGAGNLVPYRGGYGWFSVNNASSDLHINTPGYITWVQLNETLANGWDVDNHGYSSANCSSNSSCTEEIVNNTVAVYNKTGVNMTQMIKPPNGDHLQYMFDNGIKAVYAQQSIFEIDGVNRTVPTDGVNVSGVVNLTKYAMSRHYYDDDLYTEQNITDYLDGIANRSVNGTRLWAAGFSHRVWSASEGTLNGNLNFSKFKAIIDSIDQRYGRRGTDRVWVAGLEEVYDYLSVKQVVNISNVTDGNTITITINATAVSTASRRKALTLLLNSSENIQSISYSSYFTNYTQGGIGSKNALLNLDWGQYFPTNFTNSAPAISAINISPVSPGVSSVISCNVTAVDSEDIPLIFNITWQKNGTAYSSSIYNATNSTQFIANFTLNSSITQVGDNWSCSAQANDSFTVSSTNFSSNITITNHIPEITNISIEPISPNASSNLTCNVSAVSSYDSSLSINITWQRNGTAYSSSAYFVANNTPFSANLTLNSTITQAGDNWSCSAWANDSGGVSATNFSSNITVVPQSEIIVYECGNITSPGSYYLNQSILLSNFDKCIDIQSDNVTFDCRGNTIQANSSNSNANSGIYVVRATPSIANIRINNCTIENWSNLDSGEAGIYALRVSNITIENIVATNNFVGVHLSSSNNSILRVINVNGSRTQYGIRVTVSSKNISISNVSIKNSLSGLIFNAVSNSTVNSSIFQSNGWNGVSITSSNGISFYNNIFNNTKNIESGSGLNNTWNITLTDIHPGSNIRGSIYLGGNYWTSPTSRGFSNNCTDVLHPLGICDSSYVNNESIGCASGICDYLPLSNRTQTDSNPSPIVLLDQPANGYFDNSGIPANLSFNATLSGINNLSNCSFWHNVSGTWLLNQSKDVGGTFASVNFTLENLFNKSFAWNIECYDITGRHAFADANHSANLSYYGESLQIGYPVAYVLYQRHNSTTGEIKIVGSYLGAPGTIEARFNGEDWQTIVASPSGNSFTGYFNASVGNGTLETRFSSNHSINSTLQNISIGDLFVIAGQSNAEARGDNFNNISSSNQFLATAFKENSTWKIANDPIEDNVSNLNESYGSPYPRLADYIIQNQSIPVAFIASAFGGSTIDTWQKGNTRYDFMYNQIRGATNGTMKVKAMLFYQGESDTEDDTYTTYKTKLNNTINSFINDTQIAEKALVTQILLYTPSYTAIRKAQQDLWAEPNNVYEGVITYDVNPIDNGHFRSDAEIGELARRWEMAVADQIYNVGNFSGPTLINSSMRINSTHSFINLTFDKDLRISVWNGTVGLVATGWQIQDVLKNYTDDDVVSTAINGGSVLLTVDGVVSNGSLLSLGCINRSNNLPFLRAVDGNVTAKSIFEQVLSYMQTPPSILALSISPTSPNASSVLTCNVTATSAYDTTLGLNITWQKNGMAYSSAAYGGANNTPFLANFSLNSSITQVGDNWSCSAWVNDTFDSSSIILSSNISVIKYADSISLSLNNSEANLSATYSPSLSFPVNASSTTGTHSLYLNGSVISDNYTALLAAGTYNFTAISSGNENYSAATKSFFATISKAPSTLTLATNSPANYLQPVSVNCSIDNSQTAISLYRNGSLVGTSTLLVADTSVLAAGTYNYTCNASASMNYTAPTETSGIFTVNQIADSIALSLNNSEANLSATYSLSLSFPVNASSTTGTHTLYLNGSVISDNYTALLAAGAYNFTAISTGNENYSAATKSFFANIIRAPSIANISANNGPIPYGQNVTINCSIDNTQSNLSLYQNGSLIEFSIGSNFSAIIQSLAMGTYNYTCNGSESENYSVSNSASINVTIYYANISALKLDQTVLQPSPGGTVQFNMTITNIGNVTLDPTEVVDVLPAGLTYLNAYPVPSSNTSQAFTWNNVGPLAQGASTTIYINATVDAGTVSAITPVLNLTNSMSATGMPPNGDNVTAQSTANVTIYYANISAVKVDATPLPPSPGGIAQWSINISNPGQVTLNPVFVADALPFGFGFAGASPSPSDISADNASINWTNVGPILAGGSVLILLNSSVDSAIANGTYNNTVMVIGTPPNGDSVSDSDVSSIGVFAPAINIVKSVNPSSLLVGGIVTYTLNISNTGSINLSLTVIDELPSHVAFNSSDVPPTNISGQTVTWQNIAIITPSSSFTIVYNVSADMSGTYANNATAIGTPPNGNNVSDSDSAMFTANPIPISSGGGSSSKTPTLTYTFNCTSGVVSATVTDSGTPINNLQIRFAKADAFGNTYANTNAFGIAFFNITQNGRYVLESQLTSTYLQAYVDSFQLALCPAANASVPPVQNITLPITPTQNTTVPSSNITVPTTNITSPAQNNTSSQASANLTQLETQAREAIDQAQAEIDSAKAAGADTSQAESSLSDAILSLNTGNFEQALSQAKYAPTLIIKKEDPHSQSNAPVAPSGQSVNISQLPIPASPSLDVSPVLPLFCATLGILAIIGGALFLLKRKKKHKGLAEIK